MHVIAWLTVLGGVFVSQGYGQSFTPIGTTSCSGADRGFGYGISPDGSVVVGNYRSSQWGCSNLVAFRWSKSVGFAILGDLPGGLNASGAVDASEGGAVIAGVGRPEGDHSHAFVYTDQFGLQDLGSLAAPGTSEAEAVSRDGRAIAGFSAKDYNGGTARVAVRWWWQEGRVEELQDIAGGNFLCLAIGISDDGSTVVGYAAVGGTRLPVRWDSDGACTPLESPPSEGQAEWCTGNGQYVLGITAWGPMVWNGPDVAFVLDDDLPQVHDEWMLAMSDNVSRIVGWGTYNGETAIIWDPVHGTRILAEVLANEYGLGGEISGWTLRRATAISADGRLIAGFGKNPSGWTQPWVVDLGPQCPADFNMDGALDSRDFLSFQTAFGNEEPRADLAPPAGILNLFDFLAFQTAFGNGC